MCREAYCVIPTHGTLSCSAEDLPCVLCVSVSQLFDSDFEIPSKNVTAYETATTDTAQAVAQFSATNKTKNFQAYEFTKITTSLSGRHTRQRVIHNSYMNFTVVCCFLGGQREGTAENGSCLRNEKLKQNNKKNKHNRDAENGSMEIVFIFQNNETLILARNVHVFCAALLEKRKQAGNQQSRVRKVASSVKAAREIY